MSPIRFADRGVFAQQGVMPLELSMSLVDGVSSEPDVEMNAAPEGSTPLTSSDIAVFRIADSRSGARRHRATSKGPPGSSASLAASQVQVPGRGSRWEAW